MKTLTLAENDYFVAEQAFHEATCLAGTNPRQQSGDDVVSPQHRLVITRVVSVERAAPTLALRYE